MNYQIGHRIQQQTRNGRFGYRLESVEPYTTIRGVPSAILTWRGTCAVCGAAFSVHFGQKTRTVVTADVRATPQEVLQVPLHHQAN
jgi:hypothetical protein